MTNYKDFLNEQLQNEKFKKEYDALDAEFSIVQAMIRFPDSLKRIWRSVPALHRRT